MEGKNGREQSSINNNSNSNNNNNNSNNNSIITNNSCCFPRFFPRDSEEASAKVGSREESWVGAVAPFVSPTAFLGTSLQTVPRSETLESSHGLRA